MISITGRVSNAEGLSHLTFTPRYLLTFIIFGNQENIRAQHLMHSPHGLQNKL